MARRGYVDPEINVTSRRAPLLVGRDPGDEEVYRGQPFVGKTGSVLFGGYDLLTKQHIGGAVAHAGLMRPDVNITNRVLRHPWNSDFHRHARQDVEDGRRKLFDLIEELQPSIIVALGAHAAYDLVPGWATLTDREPGEFSGGRSVWDAKEILDRRGFLWYPEDGTGLPCPVLATLHPAACLYQPMPHRVLLDIDFQRLGAVMQGRLPRQHFPTPTRIYRESDMDLIWDAPLVAYDIEVKWGGTEFLCIAFYTSTGHAFLAYDDAFMAVVPWLLSDRPKLAHNSQFDRYFLEEKMHVPVGGRHEDTICGHWACYPELAGKKETGRETQKKATRTEITRKGLNFLASFHLNHKWWKTYTSSPSLMGQLCSNDVVATMQCWERVEKDIEQLGVRWQYERQIAKLPALISVQRRGFLVDEAMRQSRVAAIEGRQATLESQAREAALAFITKARLTHREDGKEYWWYHAARCECCGGGSKIAAHCHRCAGLADTKKPTLVLWAWRGGMERDAAKALKVADLLAMLPPCKACDGIGKVDTWDFNPMSPTQMPALLWDHLGVPKYCYSGSPNADEETLKKVLEWATGDDT